MVTPEVAEVEKETIVVATRVAITKEMITTDQRVTKDIGAVATITEMEMVGSREVDHPEVGVVEEVQEEVFPEAVLVAVERGQELVTEGLDDQISTNSKQHNITNTALTMGTSRK